MADAPLVITHEEFRRMNAMLDVCTNCGGYIHLMCRKGTGICSENCEKESKRATESR